MFATKIIRKPNNWKLFIYATFTILPIRFFQNLYLFFIFLEYCRYRCHMQLMRKRIHVINRHYLFGIDQSAQEHRFDARSDGTIKGWWNNFYRLSLRLDMCFSSRKTDLNQVNLGINSFLKVNRLAVNFDYDIILFPHIGVTTRIL